MKELHKSYHHGDLKAAVLARAAEIIATKGLAALSLRSVARDLGVSHGAPNRHFANKAALLAALAADGWQHLLQATLDAADRVKTNDPIIRLNAMGQGFLRWALENRSAFGAITHPDVARYADAALASAQTRFRATIRDAVDAAQQAGRQTDANPLALLLFTHAVPFGAAMILANPLLVSSGEDQQPEHQLTQHELIAAVINLVVPVTGAAKSSS